MKPGFLSAEYKMGRRASYLNPIRMYVFTSAIFFLIFFSLYHIDEKTLNVNTKFNADKLAVMDSASFAEFTAGMNKGKPMSRKEFAVFMDTAKQNEGLHFTGRQYESKKEYDSLLATGVKKHNWLERTLIYREIQLNEKYHNDSKQILAALLNVLMHNIPQMLFISLPLFAFFLKLLYSRRKQFYYASHIIFSIHLYIFVFIVLFAIISLNQLSNYVHWGGLSFITGLLYLLIFFYEYKAMRNFYAQRRAKTIIKFLLLNLWLFFIVMILFVIYLFFSFLKV